MKTRFFVIILIQHAYGLTSTRKCFSNTLLSLPQGIVNGTSDLSENYTYFLGIPYATVKERFEEPGDPPTWKGILKASPGPIVCKQIVPSSNMTTGQEDCLILNVFIPILRDKNPLPVMVFIHGGAFYKGSSSKSVFNPKFLVQKNVIVVTLNYRLGAFGFLCLKNKGAPGNAGLKDQLAALKWVKNNIAYFGGNPNCVTLFGESVGGTSVNYLILSPSTRGLFNRAIIESGSIFTLQALDKNPIETASVVASRLGYNSTDPDELLKIFKTATADDIAKASFADPMNDALGQYVFRPCIENNLDEDAIITSNPRDLQKSVTELSNMSIIIGYNNEEGIMWAAEYDSNGFDMLNSNFTSIIPDYFTFKKPEYRLSFIEDVKQFYFKNSTIEAATVDNLIDYFSDAVIMYPAVRAMEGFLTNNNIPMYNYYFKYDSPRNSYKLHTRLRATPGASHGDELPYIFDPKEYQGQPLTPYETKAINIMTSLWTNFAKTGIPSSPTQVQWCRSEGKLKYLQLDDEVKMITMPNKERIEFWKKSREKYGSF